MAGEVVLFQGGGCEGCFGVEEAGELGDEGFSLFGLVPVLYCLVMCMGAYSLEEVFELRFESEFFLRGGWWGFGHGGILGVCMEEAFCLYHMLAFLSFYRCILLHTCVSSERACCRS